MGMFIGNYQTLEEEGYKEYCGYCGKAMEYWKCSDSYCDSHIGSVTDKLSERGDE